MSGVALPRRVTTDHPLILSDEVMSYVPRIYNKKNLKPTVTENKNLIFSEHFCIKLFMFLPSAGF